MSEEYRDNSVETPEDTEPTIRPAADAAAAPERAEPAAAEIEEAPQASDPAAATEIEEAPQASDPAAATEIEEAPQASDPAAVPENEEAETSDPAAVGQTENAEAEESVEAEEPVDAARIETFTENLRITVAITDAAGKPLQAQTDENGEVYVVSSQGTRLIKTEDETQKTKKSRRARRALGLLCFFSILFIAVAIILDVVFRNAIPDLEYVGTIFSSFAQAVAYLFLAIHGFQWVNEPGRKLGWKIAYWIGVALVFITLIVGTTLAFTHLIPSK